MRPSDFIPMLTDLLHRLHDQGIPKKENAKKFYAGFLKDHGWTSPIPMEVSNARSNFINVYMLKGLVPGWVRKDPQLYRMFIKVAEDYREINEDSKPKIKTITKNEVNISQSLPTVKVPTKTVSTDDFELKKTRTELEKMKGELEILKMENIRYKDAISCAEESVRENEDMARLQREEITILRQREDELQKENEKLRNNLSNNVLRKALKGNDFLIHGLQQQEIQNKKIEAYDSAIRTQEGLITILKQFLHVKDDLIARAMNSYKPYPLLESDFFQPRDSLILPTWTSQSDSVV